MAGGKRVLVVEDEILIRMLAVAILTDLGYQCDEAGNAAEALDNLQRPGADYAFIFLDIGLPDRNGDELIKDIRTSQALLPILVASGEEQSELATRLGGFAPIAFLTKPYDIDHVRQALRDMSVSLP